MQFIDSKGGDFGCLGLRSLPEFLLKLAFEHSGVLASRFKRQVAARDKRHNPGETERLENPAQNVHLDDSAPTDVDGPQECNESWHGAVP